MNDRELFALDLGSSKVAFLASRVNESGEVEVLDITTSPNKGIQRGIVTDLDATASAISEATRGSNIAPGTEITVSVNGAHLDGLNAQGFVPIVPANRTIHGEDLLQVINHSRQVVPSPDREQIMALPREFRVDGQRGIKRPEGMSGNRLEVVTHLITGQIAHLSNVERAVEMAGFKIGQMVPSAIAAGMAVTSEHERDAGCAIVDIGAGTTSIAIFTNGSPCSIAVLPVGGTSVSSDLAKLLKMAPEEADNLKKEHGRAIKGNIRDDSTVEVRQIGQNHPRHLQRSVLYEIVESRMREIANLVRAQIERSGLYGMLPGGVILTGGSSQLNGTVQLFAEVLHEPNVRQSSPQCGGPAGVRAGSPEFSVAVGLAEYALQATASDVVPAGGIGSWKERIFSLFQLRV